MLFMNVAKKIIVPWTVICARMRKIHYSYRSIRTMAQQQARPIPQQRFPVVLASLPNGSNVRIVNPTARAVTPSVFVSYTLIIIIAS